MLSRELEPRHVAIATRLIGAEAERPRDTVEARALLASRAWPRSVPEARPFVAAPVSERELSLRLTARGGALYRDTLLEREVIVLPATPETLARVLPFARASHPALASVLAHRPDEASVWIESVAGARCNTLDAADRQTIAEALGTLHRAGGAHGAVDREHLVRRGGCLVLCFPLSPGSVDPEADLRALAALES
jgi:serine/threonine-protein kinase